MFDFFSFFLEGNNCALPCLSRRWSAVRFLTGWSRRRSRLDIEWPGKAFEFITYSEYSFCANLCHSGGGRSRHHPVLGVGDRVGQGGGASDGERREVQADLF